MRSLLLSAVLAIGVSLGFAQETTSADRAAPIPPPPEDKSNLPAPREGVVMVRVVDGRLNVQLGGWGGQRIIHAKTEPETFRRLIREVKSRGLNCVRPLFHPPNAANKNDSEWATFDWEAMDRAVAMTQEEGVYFLVDYHNWLVNDTIHADEETWLKNWGWIIDRYKPYKHMIFEGFNEPQNQCPCMAEHYQKWVNLVREKGAEQMVVVSPFWGQYFKIEDPKNNWAQCRHHYFNGRNSPTVERGQREAEHHLTNLDNQNSVASAIKAFGCGFFMTEGGIDAVSKDEAEMAGRLAGVQRMIEVCEEQGYGWCLWAHGEWTTSFYGWGSRVKPKAKYPSITGEIIEPAAPQAAGNDQ